MSKSPAKEKKGSKTKAIRDLTILFATGIGIPILIIFILLGLREPWVLLLSAMYFAAVGWFLYDKIIEKGGLYGFLKYLLQKIADALVVLLGLSILGSPIVVVLGILLKIVSLVILGVLVLFAAISVLVSIRKKEKRVRAS